MPRKITKLSASDLKTFRHHVSILKQKGLISKTDARSAQPYWVRNGERLDKVVRRNDDILSNKAAAVKVSDKQLRQYRKAGYETRRGRVIIPHTATERVKAGPGGTIKISKTGIKRVEIPVPFRNLEQWVRDARKQSQQLDTLREGRGYWAYKFKGHNSYATYTSLDLMLQEMTIGTGSGLNLMDKARNTTRKQQEEIYQNLTFFALDNKYNWERPDFAKRRREGRKGKRMGRRSEISKARHAEEERLRRARMTGRKKSEYKRKAKKRAAKSRKNG